MTISVNVFKSTFAHLLIKNLIKLDYFMKLSDFMHLSRLPANPDTDRRKLGYLPLI